MKIEFVCNPSPYHQGYYMIGTKASTGNIINRRDQGVADILGIERWEYHNYMYKLFNGRRRTNSSSTRVIHFERMEDCKRAAEWLNSYLVMKKLRGA